jgi:hypothetical protein
VKSAGAAEPQYSASPVLAGASSAPQPAPEQAASAPQDVRPVAAYAPAPSAATPAAPEEKKPVETRGLHNVVQSGKSDMMAPTPVPPAAPAPPSQYSYGQANTAGDGAAFR